MLISLPLQSLEKDVYDIKIYALFYLLFYFIYFSDNKPIFKITIEIDEIIYNDLGEIKYTHSVFDAFTYSLVLRNSVRCGSFI